MFLGALLIGRLVRHHRVLDSLTAVLRPPGRCSYT